MKMKLEEIKVKSFLTKSGEGAIKGGLDSHDKCTAAINCHPEFGHTGIYDPHCEAPELTVDGYCEPPVEL